MESRFVSEKTQINAGIDYCDELSIMLKTQRAVGRTGKIFQSLVAASTRNNLKALRFFMLEFKPEKTLEIGLAFGASALTIAASHKDLKRLPSKQHVALDPFQGTTWDYTGCLALEKAELLQYVEILEDYSHFALPKLLNSAHKYDLIYIDGSHLFEDVFIDFFYCNKLLSKGGLLLFDDSSDPHVKKVLNFIDINFSFNYEKLNLSFLYSKFHRLKYKAAVLSGRNQLTAYRKLGTANERPWNTTYQNF